MAGETRVDALKPFGAARNGKNCAPGAYARLRPVFSYGHRSPLVAPRKRAHTVRCRSHHCTRGTTIELEKRYDACVRDTKLVRRCSSSGGQQPSPLNVLYDEFTLHLMTARDNISEVRDIVPEGAEGHLSKQRKEKDISRYIADVSIFIYILPDL